VAHQIHMPALIQDTAVIHKDDFVTLT
jgi:hypothetical protein